MTTHAEKRNMPYSAEQLFKLVADVERYPEFLPWCIECCIKPAPIASSSRRRGSSDPRLDIDSHLCGNDNGERCGNDEITIFYADLTIGYKMFREKFGSKVTLKEHNLVHVEYLSGPMKYLSNHWKFIAEDDGSCTVDFYVDFEFKNRVLQNIIGMFFTEAMQKMVRAFEGRAHELYGDNKLNQ